MKTLSAIKKDLEFNKDLSSLIEVLKNIAVSQYRTLERKMSAYEHFLSTIESFVEFIDVEKVKHPFLFPEDRPQIVVAVTSDSGLLGGLNMKVVMTALAELGRIPGKLIVIGECGKIYARETKVPFVAFSGINDEDRYFQASQLRDYIFDKAAEGGLGYLKVVYPHPVSFTVQRVQTVPFLPFTEVLKGKTVKLNTAKDVILESRPGDLIEYLVYLWIGQRLFDIFGLSRLAEFAARFVHLEESSQKIEDMDKKMRLQYFRMRHELIDRNMRELFSARLLFASKKDQN